MSAELRGGEGPGVEHTLLTNRRRDSITALLLSVATLVVFVLVAFRAHLPFIQRFDNRWLRMMVDVRSPALTGASKVFNFLGGIFVTLPVRLAVAGFLAWKRRWWHFAAFASAMVISEILIGTLKGLYERHRPPASLALVPTSGGSFPSGHAVAASVTAVAIVIALFPSGPRRWMWGAVAVAFAFLMALSRVYLAAHWFSDVVGGTLMGTAVAVDAAWVVQEIWDHRVRRRARSRSPDAAAGTPSPGG